MEFGNLVPLFLLFLACAIMLPIVGLILLFAIRFLFKDPPLARNILLTILAVSLCWFLVPVAQLILGVVVGLVAFPLIGCRACPDQSLTASAQALLAIWPSAVASAYIRGVRLLLIPGLASGFLVAFLLVTPITFLVRYTKRPRDSAEHPEEAAPPS